MATRSPLRTERMVVARKQAGSCIASLVRGTIAEPDGGRRGRWGPPPATIAATMDSLPEVYQRAKRLLAEEPETLLAELDRVLAAAQPDRGERLAETVRLAEMALVSALAPWWAGPAHSNVRAAVERLEGKLHDRTILGLGLRLAAGYARQGRVDDEAHRLMSLAARLEGTGLPHPDAAYAEEARRCGERALFFLSPAYAYRLVRDEAPEDVAARVRSQLARGNCGLAALLCELRLVRALDDWYVGQVRGNVARALAAYAERRPVELHELAVLLARAYVQGAFVDPRARRHVEAVLGGEEAKLLGPDEAIALREFVDRDAFDYSYAELYEGVRDASPDALREAVRGHTRRGNFTVAQRLCELALVRAYDDWYVGRAESNVRGAIARYLAASSEEEQPAADWCAHYLAGLYAATLAESPAARRLVRALVERGVQPAFREAIESAGIPPDVEVGELHRLYEDSVSLEARLETFKAQASESGGLSDYEQRAYLEVLEFFEQEESSAWGGVAASLGELAEEVVSESLVRAGTAAVEDALRLALGSARATLRRDRILGELARRDPRLRSLERARTADLALLDELAWSLTRENRVVAALEGFGCGLGGPTLVLVDVPLLTLVNLNAVATVATIYGYDVDLPREREFLVSLLAGRGEALRELLGGLGGGSVGVPGGEGLASSPAALAVHGAAAKIAARLLRQKLLGLLPVLGGAVSAGLNFHYTTATVRTAVMAYRGRWLQRRVAERR
ncbi:MAG: hypothetical protein D6731_01135 [Planctomycetota bacterium]|nr:MAG: hypothetical protein D6731_01135 [Planctomycetota bacterium]